MDVKVREEARKAFLDALKRQAEEYGSMLDWLNPERGMSGVRLDGTWDLNAAIDAYEAALKAAGYEIAETVESMTGRALTLAAQNDEHEKRFRERYVTIPKPQAMSKARASAYVTIIMRHCGPEMGENETQMDAYLDEARAMIEAATNPAP